MKNKIFSLLTCFILGTLIAFADGPFRNHRYDGFKAATINENSIVFIGNSITNMHDWYAAFNNPNVVNRGVSGGYATEILANLESYIAGKPAKVFLMIGTNDMAPAGLQHSPEQIASSIRKIVDRIQNESPLTEIYLTSIFPSTSGGRTLEKIQAANTLIKALAEEKNLVYVDLYNDLQGILNNTDSQDGLHLSMSGYRIWCNKVAEYVGSDCVYPADATNQYATGVAAYKMRVSQWAATPITADDILMIGDEMINGGEWKEMLGYGNIRNCGQAWGYPGASLEQTLQMMPLLFNDLSGNVDPKQVFLYAGVSELNGSTELETIKTSYQNVVSKIRELAPTTKINLMSLQPTSTAATNTNRIEPFNAWMKTLAEGEGNAAYVDIYTGFENANGVADGKYFSGNYLWGLGYAKVASILAPMIEGASAMTEAQAEAQINLLNARNALGLAISNLSDIPFGDGTGQYPTSLQATINGAMEDGYALLNKADVTVAELEAGTQTLTNTVNSLSPSINMPQASTDGDEHWYQISSLRASDRFVTAEGAATGIVGIADDATFANSMWKFVKRSDDTYDIINREYGSYISPASAKNTQLQTTEAQPENGWTMSYANTQGYFIISSGQVQLHQTGSPQTFKIYNWSDDASLGSDRSDAGCQLKITDAPEPAVRPVDPNSVVYTLDKLNGNLYHANGSANQSYNCAWRSTATPQLQFGCGTTNNMNWSGNNIQLMTGGAESSTYTFTAPEGYLIEEYSFTLVNNGHSTAINVTFGSDTFTTSSEDKVLSATAQRLSTLSFTLSGTNGNGVLLKDCSVKIKKEELFGSPETISYTVDKIGGDNYRDGTTLKTDASWCKIWKSKNTYQLTFGTNNNNIQWSGNNLNIASGGGSSTYTLTPPEGYYITDYSFTFVNNGGAGSAKTITMDNGKIYTTSSTEQTVSISGKKLANMSFVLSGNNEAVLLKNFTVNVKQGTITNDPPVISTEGDVHWYYIINASTQEYCKGQAIYYNSDSQKMQFAPRSFRSEYVWSFWEQNGKLTIKNYRGEHFGTAGEGTGGTTAFGVLAEPNYIYNVTASNGAYIIKDSGVELHAQDDNDVIVRWAVGENGTTSASLWKFEEVDVTNAAASVESTQVEQGKVTTGIGNKDQGIIRATLRVGGLEGLTHVNSIQGKFTGTNPDDVTKVKVYLASNSRELNIDQDNKMPWREQNAELCSEGTLNADNSFSLDVNKDFAPGNHYLWIAYDIAETAKEGNTVDAQVVSYVVDNNTVTEANGNPAHAATVFLNEGTVLISGDMGTTFYRIPSITVTKDGTRLVTLTDDRKNHNTDLPAHCYLVAQYSDDFGKTWTQPKTVAGTAETGGDYGHGDASIVTNRDNGDIIGIMTSAGTYGHGFYAGTAQEPPRWKTIVSHDNGETWEAPVDHTDDLFGANCDNPETQTWKSGFSGSGAALQKRDGTLVSSFVNRAADNSQHFYFFMSKDGGKNWYVSGTSGTSAADEPKTLERNNGDLAISVRASGYNYHNITSDDGATWKYPSQTRFTTGISGNACDGEYMVWCSTLEGNPWNIAFQTLPNSGSRQNVSIALSTDEGETFGTPKTICPRGSAYSATTVLPDGTLGIYYEENSLSAGYTMRFVRCSLDWASNGQYKFTEDQPFHPHQTPVAPAPGIDQGAT